MASRRDFLKTASLAALLPWSCTLKPSLPEGILLNDVHSQLNESLVRRVARILSLDDLQRTIEEAGREGLAVSIAGGRHAMGGQQFGRDTIHLDTRGLTKILAFDRGKGLLEAEAGVTWPDLVEQYLALQQDGGPQWGFTQKQTGADALTLGGALSANAHGRSLTHKPVVGDVDAFTLVDPKGNLLRVSRTQNAELFALAVGGYGLFGPLYSVTLRLSPRRLLERKVELTDCDALPSLFEQRIKQGYLYGDFQFAIDPSSDDFLKKGIFSCYRPASRTAIIPQGQKELANEEWNRLLLLAHTDKAKAFKTYSDFYLATNGQIYWSDTHQMSYYPENYHLDLDGRAGRSVKGSEMISEVYAPREKLPDLLTALAKEFREQKAEVIYGTVRLIEKDDETYLPWAKDRYACVVFNLHVDHSPTGIEKASEAFRSAIDIAQSLGGNYFLTYHRWARKDQVLTGYPQFPGFLKKKLQYDPEERFGSDWYRHYRSMFES